MTAAVDAASADGFVSYARADADFVDRLDGAVRERGFELWIDRHAIPPTTDWWVQTRQAIERANTFVLVLTESGLRSFVCADELAHATADGKRLLVISPDAVSAKHAAFQRPPWTALTSRQWLEVDGRRLTAREVEGFCKALALDEDRLSHHTLLLVRAKHWLEQGRGTTGLLDDEATKAYVAWLRSAERFKEPRPTDLQRTYIEGSRIWNAARRRRRRVLQAITGGLAVGGAGGWARHAWNQEKYEMLRAGIDAGADAPIAALFPDLPRGARPSYDEIGEFYRSLAPAQQRMLDGVAYVASREAGARVAGVMHRAVGRLLRPS